MIKFITNFFKRNKPIKNDMVYATIDLEGNPITTTGDGYVLTRGAEMILNAEYYPNGIIGEFPCDPKTGEKLPIVPRK